MSIWMEIHCDVNNPPVEGKGYCANEEHDYAMLLTMDVQRGYRVLKRMAIQRGWVKNRTGWVCPYCQGNKSTT